MNNLIKIDVFDALAWQAEMGADECVEAAPQKIGARGWGVEAGGKEFISATSKPEKPEILSKPTPASSLQPQAPSSIAAATTEARALADAAQDLPSLEAAVRAFNGCGLEKTATNTVFAQGIPESRLMFIGEAPGAEEDRAGVPFCGPSGKLLDLMLSFIGLDRQKNFYITNTLFWRPPGNRQPSAEELAICQPFVEKHIALVNPKILVLVGGTATKSILADTRGITRLRGQVFQYKNDYMADAVPVHVIYHPSYLLRQPLAKKQCWADLLALKGALGRITDPN